MNEIMRNFLDHSPFKLIVFLLINVCNAKVAKLKEKQSNKWVYICDCFEKIYVKKG